MECTQIGLQAALQENRRRSLDRPSTLAANGYFPVEVIGRGSFSDVKKAYCPKMKQHVAVKIMSKTTLPESYLKKNTHRELEIIRTLNHRNIIQFLEVIETTMRFYIIMQYAEKGTLLQLVQREKIIAEPRVRKYFGQLMDAVQYIHRAGIAHRDIKCENVALNAADRVKLIDFGFACRVVNKASECSTQVTPYRSMSFCGSHAYASPELLKNVAYEPMPVDIWAAGVVLYVLLFGALPFGYGKDIQKLKQCIANGVQFPTTIPASKEVVWLIKKIFVPADKRLTVGQVAKCLWLVEDPVGERDSVLDSDTSSEEPGNRMDFE